MSLSAVKQKIFLTGATGNKTLWFLVPHAYKNLLLPVHFYKGYIGGSVLWRLLNHSDRSKFAIKALVRDKTKAKRFASEYGVEPVEGSLSDLKELEAAASEADYIITTVGSYNQYWLKHGVSTDTDMIGRYCRLCIYTCNTKGDEET